MILFSKKQSENKKLNNSANTILTKSTNFVLDIFSVVFTVVFTIFLAIIFFENNFYVVALSVFCLFAVMFFLYKFNFSNINISNKKFNLIVFTILFLYFIVNFSFAYFARVNLLADVAIIYESIPDVLDDGVLNGLSPTLPIAYPNSGLNSNADYFCRYYNNIFILLLFSLIYYVFSFLNFAPGTVEGQTLILFFTSLITVITIYIIVITVKEMLKSKFYAIISLLLCILFLPFIYSTPNFYTDIWSMPFLCTGIYYFARLKNERKISSAIVCALAFSVAYLIKATAIVIIIAVIIMLITDIFKSSFDKKQILFIFLIISILLLTYICFEVFYRNCGIFDFSNEERLSLPKQTWLLFASHGDGGFLYSDLQLAIQGETIHERTQDVREEIYKVYSSYTLKEYLAHLQHKLTFTWNDPHFDTSEYTKWPIYTNFTIYFTNENYLGYFISFWFSKVFVLILYSITLINSFVVKKLKSNYFAVFSNITVFGMILYTMFFESAPRKVFIVIPFFIFNCIFLIEYLINKKKENS